MTDPGNDGKGQGASKNRADVSTVKGPRKKASIESIARHHRKKVEDAFELVEKMENYHPGESEKTRQERKKDDKKEAPRSGLRFRFGLDAFISDSDTRAADDTEMRPGKATLLNINVTVPYIWKIPFIGKTALRLIKRVQAQGAPESLRDILNSLRNKKTL